MKIHSSYFWLADFDFLSCEEQVKKASVYCRAFSLKYLSQIENDFCIVVYAFTMPRFPQREESEKISVIALVDQKE